MAPASLHHELHTSHSRQELRQQTGAAPLGREGLQCGIECAAQPTQATACNACRPAMQLACRAPRGRAPPAPTRPQHSTSWRQPGRPLLPVQRARWRGRSGAHGCRRRLSWRRPMACLLLVMPACTQPPRWVLPPCAQPRLPSVFPLAACQPPTLDCMACTASNLDEGTSVAPPGACADLRSPLPCSRHTRRPLRRTLSLSTAPTPTRAWMRRRSRRGWPSSSSRRQIRSWMRSTRRPGRSITSSAPWVPASTRSGSRAW